MSNRSKKNFSSPFYFLLGWSSDSCIPYRPDLTLEAKPCFCIYECISKCIYLAGYFGGDSREREWRNRAAITTSRSVYGFKAYFYGLFVTIFVSVTTNF